MIFMKKNKVQGLIAELKSQSTPQGVKTAHRFFKLGPGSYSEGDQFLGIPVPKVRKLALSNLDLTASQLKVLLRSPWHEVRMLGILILVHQFQQAGENSAKKTSVKGFISRVTGPDRKTILKIYLDLRSGINNWDLVDLSAYKVLGEWCLETKSESILKKFSKSPRHWDRRLAMVATLAYIKKGQVDITLQLAAQFFEDPEDLMHKAAGWMLREAGKKCPSKVKDFILANSHQMPRTMLRYSIEHWAPQERQRILLQSKKKDLGV